LIELMVVIALIAVLAALAAGTFFRIQAAEYERATTATLVKADSHLKVRWTATLEDAKKSVPPEVFALAGGDKDRALAIWTYAKLQSEFPESFDEVWVAGRPGSPKPIVLGPPGGPFVTLPPKKAFTDLASKTYTPPPTADEQAAALFYTAINSTSVGGVSPQSDGLNNQTMTLPNGLLVYKDAWGTPITFRRWAKIPEMQAPPYLHASQIKLSLAASPGGGVFDVKNPFDPFGKLLTRNPTTENPWGDPTNPLRRACLAQAPGTNPLGINLNDFTNENVLPTLISFGANKRPGTVSIFGGDDDSNDNIFSFRLRAEGKKGD